MFLSTCACGVRQPGGLTSPASLLPWNTHARRRKKKKNKHFITQTLQSRNHNSDRKHDDPVVYSLLQTWGRQGGEPFTHWGVWLEKTCKGRINRWSCLWPQKTFLIQSVKLPIYSVLLLYSIPVWYLICQSTPLRPAGVVMRAEWRWCTCSRAMWTCQQYKARQHTYNNREMKARGHPVCGSVFGKGSLVDLKVSH